MFPRARTSAIKPPSCVFFFSRGTTQLPQRIERSAVPARGRGWPLHSGFPLGFHPPETVGFPSSLGPFQKFSPQEQSVFPPVPPSPPCFTEWDCFPSPPQLLFLTNIVSHKLHEKFFSTPHRWQFPEFFISPPSPLSIEFFFFLFV